MKIGHNFGFIQLLRRSYLEYPVRIFISTYSDILFDKHSDFYINIFFFSLFTGAPIFTGRQVTQNAAII